MELPQVAPTGIRSPQVTLLGNNAATGRALINFLQIAHARGKEPNWVMRQMLDGERNVAVTAMMESRDGSARVHLQRVEVSGVPVQGAALDFLIQNYLLPNYPDAKIDQWFALKNNIDRIEVAPQVAYVVMKRARGRI
jgi:hypothetical protein